MEDKKWKKNMHSHPEDGAHDQTEKLASSKIYHEFAHANSLLGSGLSTRCTNEGEERPVSARGV